MAAPVKKISPEGIINKTPAGYTVQFERSFQHPVQKVWEAISDPGKLSVWLAAADVELVKAGKFNLHFTGNACTVNGSITQLQPPSLLEYTWDSHDAPASVVRWELFPEGKNGCRLLLTHTLAVLSLSTASGWHIYLGLLSLWLDDPDTNPTWPEEAWREAHAAYERKYG